ncbi:MAG: acetyl-CoA acetyltransferase [Microscillaceae bacterium]|jgi:acetyl-CoA C-acetyltransferase|nr:acetyl-CoA acetyltransferase [Microscillaceae bacterium]
MNEKNLPILVGASQLTQRWQDDKMPSEPLTLLQQVSQTALADCEVLNIAAHIDSVWVVNIFGWGYEDAPTELSQRLGLNPQKKFYSTFGGNTPQYLVNKICRQLAQGEIKMALLTGGEANYGLSKALKAGMKLDWTPKKNARQIDGDNRPGASDLANNYELFLLTTAYPMFETALRARAKRGIAEHQQYIGNLYAPLAQAAAQNPFAWSPVAYTAQEIAEPNDDNRYVAFPYTKRMCANNNVDQAAALILTTVGEAEKLGIPRQKWVFPQVGVDLYDIWDFERRPDLCESPAIRHATQLALAQADLQLADIEAFDLYSCFPAAVQVARQAMGIADTDPRPYSLTGGLSFFGGPWNNYSMHAIATTVDKIRQNQYQSVLVSALGWYITKHAIGIYGKNPPKSISHWLSDDYTDIQNQINAQALPEPVAQAQGDFKVLAYSLVYGRNNMPQKGIVLGELSDGKRAFAFIEASESELWVMQNLELVGRVGQVRYDEAKKRNFVKL